MLIDQVLDVEDEVPVVEVTPRGDHQARLDIEAMSLERVAEWR